MFWLRCFNGRLVSSENIRDISTVEQKNNKYYFEVWTYDDIGFTMAYFNTKLEAEQARLELAKILCGTTVTEKAIYDIYDSKWLTSDEFLEEE